MNSDPEQEVSLFEVQLETFSTQPLPENWKSELVSGALNSALSGRATLTIFHRFTMACIGAAWILIAALIATTPADSSKEEWGVEEDDLEVPFRIPRLVHHLQNRQSLTEPFSLEL